MADAHLADELLVALVAGELDAQALDQVDSHLDSCASCRELVATLTSGVSGTRHRGDDGEPETIGRFAIDRRLGEGAMGSVWEATDPELGRRVAIKRLHARHGDDKGRARLIREAQAMASLSHPHVVQVYEVGTEGDEVHVVMELVEGSSLRTWLLDERSPAEILSVLRGAGRGLAAAHAAGLVHRDFKPENVLVDAAGHAKVGDFGLARLDEEELRVPSESSLLEATLTQTGALLGTPAYMAPEQLAGEPADARSDQYAFAVTLWEALAGERPHSARDVATLREASLAGPPPAPPGLDGRIGAVLRRALAADPSARFASMAELLTALDPPARGRWRWVALAAAGVAAAGAAGVLAIDEPPPPCAAAESALGESWGPEARAAIPEGLRPILDRWAEGWRDQRVDSCEATHVRHEQSEQRLDARIRCLDRQQATFDAVRSELPLGDESALDVLELLPDPRSCRDPNEGVAPPPAAQRARIEALERRLAELRVRVAHGREDFFGALEVALRDAEQLGYAPTIARAHLLMAEGIQQAGEDPEAAIREARRGMFVAEEAGDDRTRAEAWLLVARIEGVAGQVSQAFATLEHADAAIRRVGDPDDLRETHDRLRGVAHTALGDFDLARAHLDNAAWLIHGRLGPDAPQLATVETSLGNLARLVDRLDDALRHHERALQLDRAAWGDEHPRVARDRHNLGGILRRLDRRDEARAQYDQALAIKRAALGDQHPEVGLTLNSLGLLAFEANDLDGAAERWAEALAILDAAGHGDEALVRYNLALLASRQERWAEAVEHAEEAIAIDTDNLSPESKRVGVATLLLGRALTALDQPTDARAAIEQARSIGVGVGDPPLIADADAALAELEPEPEPRRRRRTAAPPPTDTTPEPDTSPDPPPTELEPPPQPEPRLRPTGSGVYGGGRAWD